jgi:hypothetical protein
MKENQISEFCTKPNTFCRFLHKMNRKYCIGLVIEPFYYYYFNSQPKVKPIRKGKNKSQRQSKPANTSTSSSTSSLRSLDDLKKVFDNTMYPTCIMYIIWVVDLQSLTKTWSLCLQNKLKKSDWRPSRKHDNNDITCPRLVGHYDQLEY